MSRGSGQGLRVAALLASCALSACANHIRYTDADTEQEQRSVLSTRYGVDAPEGVLESTHVRLAFDRHETVESRVERISTRYEESTPYRGTRELIEVPLGLLLVPLSFGLNLCDLLLMGYIPNELVNGYAFWTFAALNPALNTEDPARVQRDLLSREPREFKRSQQEVREPLRDGQVALALDEGKETRWQTDADGVLRVDLLRLMATAPAGVSPRRLMIVIRDPAGAERLRQGLFLDRRFARRLAQVAPLARIAADERASPDAMAQAIFALDRLGFREESAELEQVARERLDGLPNALSMMLRGLDTLYASSPDVDGLLENLAARHAERDSVPASRAP